MYEDLFRAVFSGRNHVEYSVTIHVEEQGIFHVRRRTNLDSRPRRLCIRIARMERDSCLHALLPPRGYVRTAITVDVGDPGSISSSRATIDHVAHPRRSRN